MSTWQVKVSRNGSRNAHYMAVEAASNASTGDVVEMARRKLVQQGFAPAGLSVTVIRKVS